MPGLAQLLRLRLFLEGIEVPVVSAQVSIGINAPSAAAIQVVPLDEIFDLKPRTMVHLFFLDLGVKEEATLPANQAGPVGVFGGTAEYKILFSGEVVGLSAMFSPVSRQAVLQCLDFSSYWDTAHATTIEYGPTGNAFDSAVAVDAGDTALFDNIVNYQPDRITSLVKGTPSTPGLTSITGLAGGIIHLLEAFGGISDKVRGFNDFFTIAEMRCRLLGQITSESGDNTAQHLLSARVTDEWIRSGLQNSGTNVTLRQMLAVLFKYIYYDFVPNPTGKFEHSIPRGTTRQVTPDTLVFGTVPEVQEIHKLFEDNLHTFLIDDESVIGAEAVTEVANRFFVNINDSRKKLDTLEARARGASGEVAKLKTQLDVSEASFKAILSSPAVTKVEKVSKSVLLPAVEELRKFQSMIESSPARVKFRDVTMDASVSQRFHTQIMRPDCWFAPAPKCNVIFPEMYTSVSFDRSWTTEVTRLLTRVHGSLIGEVGILSKNILIPGSVFSVTSLTKDVGTEAFRRLMIHEYHTGIISHSEWLSDALAIESKVNSEDQSKDAQERVNWAGKIALFNFYKYRFAARQISVQGRFNPMLVSGFPGVVIRSPFIITDEQLGNFGVLSIGADDIKIIDQAAEWLKAPYQFIGMISHLVHHIDQGGGTTSVSMTHARKHRGLDDEFLGTFLDSVSAKRIIRLDLNLNDTGLTNKVREQVEELLASITPQDDPPVQTPVMSVEQQSNLVDVVNNNSDPPIPQRSLQAFLLNSIGLAQEDPGTPSLTKDGSIPGHEGVVQVPISGDLKVGDVEKFFHKGTIKGIAVIGGTATVKVSSGKRAFPSASIYEEVDTLVKKNVSIEHIIKPDWMSKSYSGENIGRDIYQPFFGCDSVVDDLRIQGFTDPTVAAPDFGDADAFNVPASTSQEAVIAKLTTQENNRKDLSIERAINVLSYTYGLARRKGTDTAGFIKAYTDRSIATKTDLLGSEDLEVSVTGKVVKVTRGTFGYHSAAIHKTLVDAKNLTGLMQDIDLGLQRQSLDGATGVIAPELDVRFEKKARVELYQEALANGPAFKG